MPNTPESEHSAEPSSTPGGTEAGPSPLDQGRVLQEALRVNRLKKQHGEIAEEQDLILTDPHPITEDLITPERDAELRALERRADARQRRREVD